MLFDSQIDIIEANNMKGKILQKMMGLWTNSKALKMLISISSF